MSPDPTPQQQGRDYEQVMANKIHGRPVPMSGAGFTKLDVFGFKILWSLKHTIHKSFRVDDDLFQEVKQAIYGPGGVGGDYLGAVAVKTTNHEVAAMKLDDFMLLAHRLEELTKENEALRNMRVLEGRTAQEVQDNVSTAISSGDNVGRTHKLPSRKLGGGRPFGR